MSMLLSARAYLGSLIPTGDSGDDSDINKAINHVNAALSSIYWIDGNHVNDHKPFGEMQDALKDLDSLNIADASVAVNLIVDAARNLAQTRLNEAIAGGGDAGEIAAAQTDMATGDAEAGAGEFEKAVKDGYHKAWHHAENALP